MSDAAGLLSGFASGLGVSPWAVAAALFFFLLGGFVKGAVGFALPLIAVAGSASVLPAETAVAMVILPTLLTNVQQAFREGWTELLATSKRFVALLATLMALIWVGAALLPGLDENVFFAGLGLFVLVFAGVQLAGWRPRISPRAETPVGAGVGVIAGLSGGLSGIWGPPVILYLTALSLPKAEQVRAAGAAFLLGSLMLTPAHIGTGVLNAETAPLSLLAVPPALLGMWLGQKAQDRLDLALFRRLTLIVLVLTALNLLRRAFIS